ncbi:hypothetical protein [Solibaculum mannosilyticum]|uniref:hypothetical protein n=1 Tax=Solibaculum mannosilyticum TaxID=2780922 RepID=UPI0007A88B88|nr:hypothetical protein BN3661_02006 [Eubacteriaceae bacterium CHKCI005]
MGSKYQKNIKLKALSLAIAYVSYLAVIFFMKQDFSASFICSFVFVSLSFGLQPVLYFFTHTSDYTIKDYFFNLPILYISGVYLGLEIVVGTIFIFLPFRIQISFTVQVILFALALILIISGITSKEMLQENEQKRAARVASIKEFSINLERLYQIANSPEQKQILKVVCNDAKYSYPSDAIEIGGIEVEIRKLIDNIESGIIENDPDKVSETVNTLHTKFQLRNEMVKNN